VATGAGVDCATVITGDGEGGVTAATIGAAVSAGVVEAAGVISETGDVDLASLVDRFLSNITIPKQITATNTRPPPVIAICFCFRLNLSRSVAAGAEASGLT
jgi:hypothetical protein